MVSSLVELVLLRGLGLPASLAIGFDNCGPGELEQCMRQLRWPPPNATKQASEAPGRSSTEFDPSPSSLPYPQTPPNTARSNPEPVNLSRNPGLDVIFVGWQLDSLEPGEPIAMEMIRDNLYLLESSHKVDLIGIDLWSPSPKRSRSCSVSFRPAIRNAIAGKIVQSLANQCSSFLAMKCRRQSILSAPIPNYLVALRKVMIARFVMRRRS